MFTWLLVGTKNSFSDNQFTPPSAIKNTENENIIAEQISFKSWVQESINQSDNNKLNRASTYLHYEKYCI